MTRTPLSRSKGQFAGGGGILWQPPAQLVRFSLGPYILFYHCDAFLRNVFLMFFVHNFNRDTIVKSVFQSRHDAVNDVWLSFEHYVNL